MCQQQGNTTFACLPFKICKLLNPTFFPQVPPYRRSRSYEIETPRRSSNLLMRVKVMASCQGQRSTKLWLYTCWSMCEFLVKIEQKFFPPLHFILLNILSILNKTCKILEEICKQFVCSFDY